MTNVINNSGYKVLTLGNFKFERDEYFAYITWPKSQHIMQIDSFLRALMRDIAWGFFYGTVNFDQVFGTVNHYGTVDVFSGKFNGTLCKNGLDYCETFSTEEVKACFEALLADWTNPDFDPFAAPRETAAPWGVKQAGENSYINRNRETAKRMVGLKSDAPIRTDATGHVVNEHFKDVAQDQPEVIAKPGFEDDIAAFNLFAYLSRSDVTWNPSICSVVEESLFCPTTEEFTLPVIHGNDRVEWFIQLTDEITWNVEDKNTGEPKARVIMKAGDIAAMPADIRHQGYSPKRSMLLVWENAAGDIPELIRNGLAPSVPVEF